MRFKATIFVLIVLLSSLSGCLTNENPAPAGNDDEAWLNKFEFKNPGRSLLIGEIEVTNLFEEQRSKLYSIIQDQRTTDFNSDEIPSQGGNWTHYFVCSNGERIDWDTKSVAIE